MNYKILGDSDYPMLHIQLKNQKSIKIERGCMAYLSNVAMEGKMNSNKSGVGGMLGALGRSMTSGESFFITHAIGLSNDSFIGIAPVFLEKFNVFKSVLIVNIALILVLFSLVIKVLNMS